jgi:hypothetical protein
MRLLIMIGAVCLCGAQAQANVGDYCAAYARDFADHVQKQDPQWQHRFDNAESACMLRFTTTEQPVVKAKPKKTAARKPAAAVVTPLPEPKPEPKPEPEKQVAKAIPKLESGTPEWTTYCKKKYVSFDEKKGTYLSKTGIERKCLVTAD